MRRFSRFDSVQRRTFISVLTGVWTAVSLHAQVLSPAAEQLQNLNGRLLAIVAAGQSNISNSTGTAPVEAAEVIEQRAGVLSELIQHEPAQALKFALPPELLTNVAVDFSDSAGQLESYVTQQGTIQKGIFDGADLKSFQSVTRMKVGDQTFDLYFAGAEPKCLKSGDILSVSGISLGNSMAVASSTIQAAASTPQTCSTTGVQNTAVLLVTFPGVTLPSTVTQQSVNDIFFGTSTGHSLDGFLREASYGQTSATGAVFGPYTLTGSYTSCSDIDGAVLNDAIAAALATGVNLNNYTRIFLAFPDIFGCGWAGFVPMGCGISSSSGTFNASIAYVITGYMTSRDPGVALVAHEMGHDLGLLHSGVITAGTDVLGPVASPGIEYDMNGDYWSVMGEMVLGLYPAPQKAEVLGWLSPNSNYEVVQNSGMYTLQPLEATPPGLQALKVQRGTGNNQWLWIEYRQPIDTYDSTLLSQPYSGALIRYEDSNTALGHTYLPNFTPTDTSWNSPALAVGQTWTDPYTNLSLSVLSATSSGLTVSVDYRAMPCTHSNPNVSLSPANSSVFAGSTATYAISLSNNDTSACAASMFALGSTQPAGWVGSLGATSLTINPGETASATLVENIPLSTPPGSYSLAASATNGLYTGSGTANTTVVAPQLTDTLSASGSTFAARQTIPITATVLYNRSGAGGASVTFTLTKPNGASVAGTAVASSSGNAAWSYKLAQKDPPGTYVVNSKATYNGQTASSNTITFAAQ